MNKEFLKMQKLAGLITESQIKETMGSSEGVPLTPEVKQYIDDAIAELRNSQSDEEWAGLERAEFWGNEFGEGVWEHFQNKFPEALDVSQEVYDYIFDKVAEYDNQVNETEDEMAGMLNRLDKNKSLKVDDITTIKSGKYKGKKVKIVADLGGGSYGLEFVS
jgi:hypothetical protein